MSQALGGAFSFVDRITEVAPGRARGSYLVPAALARFSPGLVAEAVGQLAAWVAMARTGFRRRPLAALAGAAHFVAPAEPGRVLELGVEIDRWGVEAMAYGGWARVAGQPVLELSGCVGAMMAMAEFADPEAGREHFELLCGAGVAAGRFRGVEAPQLTVIERVPGERLRAWLQVPAQAPFFAEHFPRRAVFPATLLVDAGIALARQALPNEGWPQRVENVKLRTFILPGQVIEIRIDSLSQGGGTARCALSATVEGKLVATARIVIVTREVA
ncbi:MAG: hypothetical protein HY699_00255 [Deltaproteobacteria bacterium]|nr:hypothetical protein [Deltaproteobacteria bacterium]